MKLISMTDYVLSVDANTTEYSDKLDYYEVFEYKVSNYAQFLKQPLKLEMFVPCDEEGNVLEEPLEVLTISKGHLRNNKNYNKELNQYQKAKEKVLFKGFDFKVDSLYIKGNFITWTNIFENLTIEDLPYYMYDIKLTENAIKQL